MNSTTAELIEKRYGKLKVYPDGFSMGSMGGEPIIQSKPWGGEVWVVVQEKYAMKHIVVEASKRFSLQKHTKKEETWYIVSGSPIIVLGEKKFQAKKGDVIHVSPGTAHRMEAGSSDVEFFEVSTGFDDLWDITRLEDDYGR